MNKNKTNKKIVHGFLGVIGLFILISIIFSPGPSVPNCEEPQFSALESNAIFFKNMRSYHYVIQEDKAKDMNKYLHKKSQDDPIQFLFIQQVKNTDWHIRPFLKDSTSEFQFLLIDSMPLDLQNATSYDYWNAAHYLYSKILNEEPFELSNGNTKKEILLGEDESKRAEQVLYDYFRLVGCN